MEIADYIVADDRQLARLVLGGDTAAFEYLFDRYRDAIHRLFLQRTGNAEDADDLLQETFIKVYMNLHRYSPEYTFGQWLYTIARNLCIDFYRTKQALPLEQAEQAAGDREEGDTVRIALEQALEQLPEEDRDLIFLRYTNEVSAAETGKILGLSRFAVYRREKQILKKLRTQFDWRDFYG